MHVVVSSIPNGQVTRKLILVDTLCDHFLVNGVGIRGYLAGDRLMR